MLKSIVFIALLGTHLFAINFSQMSTQELIVLIGYVKNEDKEALRQELRSRVADMSEREKIDYRAALERERTKK